MMEPAKRITINDIAALAGVSKATVSEVINNDPKRRVNPRTFERIRKIIEEHHYVPLPQARALSTSRTRQLGYLVSSAATLGLANSYYSLILAGIEAACAEFDYRCSVSRFDLTSVARFVMPSRLRQRNVDALIIAGMLGSTGSTLGGLGIPITVIGHCEDPEVFQLDSDFIRGGGEIFRYLRHNGHRKILVPCSNPRRRTEWLAAREEAGGGVDIIFTPRFAELDEFTRGEKIGEMALFHPEFSGCTALVANDQVCAGFIQTLFRYGRSIPRDYSVVAGSDTELTRWAQIPVTALQCRNFEHGRLAARMMIGLLEKRCTAAEVAAEYRKERTPDLLQIRASSGTAPDRPVNS